MTTYIDVVSMHYFFKIILKCVTGLRCTDSTNCPGVADTSHRVLLQLSVQRIHPIGVLLQLSVEMTLVNT